VKRLACFLIVPMLAFVVSCTTDSDDDDDSWDAAKVCPETGTNAYGMPNRGSFTDERDGQVYKYTTIGDQVWMAENLRYDSEFSECMDHFGDSCKTFGLYYSLYKNIQPYQYVVNDSIFEFICPNGWHIPSLDEWKTMIEMMGGFSQQSSALRLKSGNEWANGIGENACGFSAKPAGVYVNEEEGVHFVRYDAVFWTSTKEYSQDYYTIKIEKDVTVFNHFPKMTIRCLKD
jgi:Fibrobacter succinogenes major domain (Fib_succ_major).